MAKRRDIKGGVYWRNDCTSWWFNYYDAKGTRRPMSAETTDKAEAESRWREVDRQMRAEEKLFLAAGASPAGPVTVALYLEAWEGSRIARGVRSAKKDAQRIRDHAVPLIGRLPLVEVCREDLISMVRELLAKRNADGALLLRPRSVRHVYEAVRTMFADAMIARLVTGTPCDLREKRGELPSRKPDRKWKKRAIYTQQELEALISHPDIPLRRRAHYATAFLTGMRQSEIAARTIGEYDPSTQPLGRFLVDSSWNFEALERKPTKSEVDREVPVHPVLKRILHAWLSHGWEQDQGRKPTPQDLLFPAPTSSRFREKRGGHFSTQESLELLHADLDALGMRRRRFHDMRRTFITLARRRSPKDHVRWITHAPEEDIIDEYTSPEWETMCAVVSKIEVSLKGEGDVVPLFVAKRG